jgi:hypothetical protein
MQVGVLLCGVVWCGVMCCGGGKANSQQYEQQQEQEPELQLQGSAWDAQVLGACGAPEEA